MRPARLALLALTLAAAQLATATTAPPARAQSAREVKKRQKALQKIADELGVPVEPLGAVGGERWISRKAEERRELLLDVGRDKPAALLPLVVAAARDEKDEANRRAAIRLISVIGLQADRAAVVEHVLPAMPKLLGEKDPVALAAIDQLARLRWWLECDADLAPSFEAAFGQSKRRLPLAQRGFRNLLDVRWPATRDGAAHDAILAVLGPKSKFGPNERKRAIRELGRRAENADPKKIAKLMLADGTVAVECAQALADIGDPVILPALRKIDATASMKLRIPAYEARIRLGDEQLVKRELNGILVNENEQLQRAVVWALRLFPTTTADDALAQLSKKVTEPRLLRTVAMARLHRGDAGDVVYLKERLEEDPPDGWVAQQGLAIDDRAADPLAAVIARSEADGLRGQRGAAISRIGNHRIDDPDIEKLLRELQKEDPSWLRVRAAFALLQLGAEDGEALIEKALEEDVPPDPDDPDAGEPEPLDPVRWRTEDLGIGRVKRFYGSTLIDIFDGIGRARTSEVAPLLARWLDPAKSEDGRASPGGPEPRDEDRSPEEGSAKAPQPLPLPRWLEHAIIRRAAVRALGSIAYDLTLGGAGPSGGDAPAGPAPFGAEPGGDAKPDEAETARRKKLADRAIAALARRLDDENDLVRSAALSALAEIAGEPALPPGAPASAEAPVLAKVAAWLETR